MRESPEQRAALRSEEEYTSATNFRLKENDMYYLLSIFHHDLTPLCLSLGFFPETIPNTCDMV